ncbi:unnamed protein product [Nippostrongylus brasiliensis]|uniref:Tyrosine-protein phosphatase domain-containing protein n=1 Tax=Nippostrongylus brasiliensis TaxID=27835 RepID=A0A158R159_NIPBR|nr:unnamed protein product [Nippostrongylus brasiliensis]
MYAVGCQLAMIVLAALNNVSGDASSTEDLIPAENTELHPARRYCRGGTVTEEYLENLNNCTNVLGSLIITDLTEPAIIIENNSDLKSFSSADQLVFVSSGGEKDAKIDNAGLLDLKRRLILLLHPARLDFDDIDFDTAGEQLRLAAIVTTAAASAAFLLVLLAAIILAILRRMYNNRVDKLIAMSLILVDDFDLNDQQKDRLREYANEALQTPLAEWKSYCDKVINKPKIDPNYRKKPKKTPEEQKAEAQLKLLNIDVKKRRRRIHPATLPTQYGPMKPALRKKKKELRLTSQQMLEFATFTRAADEEHNFAWGGDPYAAYNKVFISCADGKVARREFPTKPTTELVLKRDQNGDELRMFCDEATVMAPCVAEFQMTIKTKRAKWDWDTLPSHTYKTNILVYNEWAEDGFPKDLRSLTRLLYAIAADKRRSTVILIGKSTDASCELFWMMIIIIKAVLGSSTAARLTSILEACIIILRPHFLTPHHFFFLLKFVLNWAVAVGVLSDKQLEEINDWRNDYHIEEVRADARLYGRPYLRVVSLDPVDVECDQVLLLLDGMPTAKSTIREEGGQEATAVADDKPEKPEKPEKPQPLANVVQSNEKTALALPKKSNRKTRALTRLLEYTQESCEESDQKDPKEPPKKFFATALRPRGEKKTKVKSKENEKGVSKLKSNENEKVATKINSKDNEKGATKLKSKENDKGHSRSNSKEDQTDVPKAKSKEDLKGTPKRTSKEDPNEDHKVSPKEESALKEDATMESNENVPLITKPTTPNTNKKAQVPSKKKKAKQRSLTAVVSSSYQFCSPGYKKSFFIPMQEPKK